MRLSSLLHARRRDALADQGGFALVAVLAVIAFTGITIAALFGLMMTTMRVTSSQEQAARERRAADGVIENAIEKMREIPCSPTAQPYLEDQVVGDVTVDVGCTSSTAGLSTTDQVRLIGVDRYDGNYRDWTVDCASNAAAPGCLAWNGQPAVGAADDMSLVHSGLEPLRFDSGVTVRRGAIAMRNPATGSPAIETGGEYNQGRPGPGSTGTDCGMLAANGPAHITDSSGSPSCGVPEAANLRADTAANVAGLVPPATPVTLAANCPTTPVVTYQPGTYSAAQTSTVNGQLTGSFMGCQNKTFWFSPGIYSFEGSVLTFSSPGSFYVFGTPQGWDPATGVQANPALVNDASAALCNPDVSGTSIVTAGWTRINHTRGRVAICPARPASDPTTAHPAIFQQTSVPNGVTVAVDRTSPNTPITQAFACRLPNPFLGYTYPDAADVNGFGECLPVRRYTLALTTAGAAPVDSLRVMLTGSEGTTPNNLISNRRSRFTVYDRTNAVICATDWVTGMPNGGITSSFDLRRLPGTCTTSFLQSRLNSGRILVEHRMQLLPNVLVPYVTQNMTIDSASVEVNAEPARVRSAADVSSSQWTSPGAVAVEDTAAATPIMPCAQGVCEVADPSGTRRPSDRFSHEMTLDNFDVAGLSNPAMPTIDPSVTSLRAVIKVTPSTGPLPPPFDGLFRIPTRVFVELTSPTGHRCVVTSEGMNSDQEIAIDLLDVNLETAAGPGCNTMPFATVSDLADVEMRLRFETPCVPDWSAPNYGQTCVRNGGNVFQLRPPGIENVSLSVGTDTYDRTSTSTVTSNAVTDGGRTSFNVYGMTWMPLTNLDIAWRGPATTTPLFANDLVLNGLGSRMFAGAAMGNVCCSPATSRTVELTASIGGVDRMVARVRFDDAVLAPDGRSSVDVLRWLNCNGACASVLSESDTNPNAPP